LMVPLLPGGFGPAEASCATAIPANITVVMTISQSTLGPLSSAFLDVSTSCSALRHGSRAA
jgi:hypothetical protein